MLPIFKYLKKETVRMNILALFIMFMLPMLQSEDGGYAWASIYADSMLGLIFAYCLLLYFNREKFDSFTVMALSIGLGTLSLTKSSPEGLALIVICTIVLDRIRIHKNLSQDLPSIITMVLFFVFAKYSWEVYCVYAGAENPWNYNRQNYFVNFFRLFSGREALWRYDVVLLFVENLAKQINFSTAVYPLSCISYIMLWLVLMSVHRFITQSKSDYFIFCLSVIGFVVYLVSLLMLYCYTFSEWEAKICASYSRYVSDFTMGMTAFWIIYVLKAVFDFKNNDEKPSDGTSYFASKMAIPLCIIVLMSCVSLPEVLKNTLAMPIYNRNSGYIREAYSNCSKATNYIDIGQKIYIVNQEDSFAFYVNHFEVAPRQTNWHYRLMDTSAEDLSRELIGGNYSYLYTGDVDSYFCSEFAELFDGEIEEKTYYKVEKLGEDRVKLIKEKW